MSVAQFDNEYEDYYIATTLAITYTKPKPPSGRQCLAGSWGNDTDRQVHYKVFSSSHFAPFFFILSTFCFLLSTFYFLLSTFYFLLLRK